MSEPRIVTIDGPAGVGKSTVAKMLSAELGVPYLDTGAMYRAVAYHLGEGSWEWTTGKLQVELDGLDFTLHGSGEGSYLKVNGAAIGDEIRTEQVGLWASNVAVLPPVRAYLKMAQIMLGRTTPLVAEGRDMGTVVFPDAEHKLFLDADPDVRAKRRYDQLRAMGEEPDLEELTAAIAKRDLQDRTRSVAPLKPADDAVVVDTTDLSLDEVFARVLAAVRGN